jgi:hypothetical protein
MQHPCNAVLLIVCLSGCFSYRGGAIPEIAQSTIAVPKMQQVIAYELRVDSNMGSDFDMDLVARREIESALRLAGADPKPRGSVADPDAQISVELKARGNPGAQFLSGFLSGFTFTLIPAYANVELVTDAELSGAAEFPKRYHYADSVSSWIQLFLIPFSNSSSQVTEDLIADMMRSLARDLQRDGFLPAPGGAALSRSYFVDARHAADRVVE